MKIENNPQTTPTEEPLKEANVEWLERSEIHHKIIKSKKGNKKCLLMIV